MKKVLITGVSGFLGHHVARLCRVNQWDVTGVDKRNLPPSHWIPEKFIQTDVRDLNFRDLMGFDYVIHLAWRTNIPDCVRHPKESTYDNIDMTVHLLEVCREAGVKKVFFPSTASLYGHNPTPWVEDMPPNAIEPYSWQKLSCEYLCKMYSEVYGLETVIGRFFQVFGELQRQDTALSAFLRNKKEGKPITLTKTTAQSTFRSGVRDFVYAGDLAEAVLLLLEKGDKGEIYNIASGEMHTMEEIANTLEAQVEWAPKRGYEVEIHHADIDKIKDLGWSPKTDVINWLKNYV